MSVPALGSEPADLSDASGASVARPKVGRSEAKARLFELALVCLIAFGGSLFLSAYTLFTRSPVETNQLGQFRWSYAAVQELGALALLWYVLRRGSRTYSDLGLRWAPRELVLGVLLWIVGSVLYTGWQAVTRSLFTRLHLSASHAREISAHFFSAGFSMQIILFLVVNPFFEELIVRAYVMTELAYLTGSLAVAAGTSVALQMSYHLYQGVPAAVSSGILFLLFSLYYAKTRRILAPILAHLLVDAVSVGYYVFYARAAAG